MENVLVEVEKHVVSLLQNELPHTFVYHNLGHTLRVIKSLKELIEGENIDEQNAEDLLIAGWFHDIGYIKSCEKHEKESAKIASNYLKELSVDADRIKLIKSLILATRMGYEPQTPLEKVICDADYSHFGKKGYSEIAELLREEWEQTRSETFKDGAWAQENITFFNKHHRFYTDFALTNWQQTKDKNLSSLYKSLKKLKKEDKKNKVKRQELKLKKNKAKTPERGVETMFRVTLRNHITLSNIADTKANILLSVNAIIVSLVLANLIPKLDNPSNTYLIYPTIIFVLFTIIAIILSVLATRPNVTSGKFSKEDVKNKKVNLLFFGNFHKMKLQDFDWAMKEMMQDKAYLYSSMTKDLYFLGKVLDKKYKILRITYTIFIIGIIVSTIAFGIAFKYASGVA